MKYLLKSIVNKLRGQTNKAKHYNSAIAAVDIAVWNLKESLLLLGRKKGQDKFCFIGGFVDIIDESYEQAAIRELSEEAPNIKAEGLEYLGSLRVDDPRYNNDKDKIFTSLYLTSYLSGEINAGDDLEELGWFCPEFIVAEETFVKEHVPLFKYIIQQAYNV